MNRLPSCVINPDAEARVGARAGEPLTPPPPQGGSNSSRPPGGAAPLRAASRRAPGPPSLPVRSGAWRRTAERRARPPLGNCWWWGGEEVSGPPGVGGWETPRPRGAEPLFKLSWVPPAAGSGAAGLSPAAPPGREVGEGGVGSACGEPPGSGLGGFLGRRAGSPPLVRTSRGV